VKLAATITSVVALAVVAAAQAAASPQKVAWERFRAWTVAIAVYREDNGTYVGMTRAKLAKWDAGVLAYPVQIGWATKTRYCLETTVAGRSFHQVGPASRPITSASVGAPAGKCPRR
jgi:hypothetical protein